MLGMNRLGIPEQRKPPVGLFMRIIPFPVPCLENQQVFEDEHKDPFKGNHQLGWFFLWVIPILSDCEDTTKKLMVCDANPDASDTSQLTTLTGREG